MRAVTALCAFAIGCGCPKTERLHLFTGAWEPLSSPSGPASLTIKIAADSGGHLEDVQDAEATVELTADESCVLDMSGLAYAIGHRDVRKPQVLEPGTRVALVSSCSFDHASVILTVEDAPAVSLRGRLQIGGVDRTSGDGVSLDGDVSFSYETLIAEHACSAPP